MILASYFEQSQMGNINEVLRKYNPKSFFIILLSEIRGYYMPSNMGIV